MRVDRTDLRGDEILCGAAGGSGTDTGRRRMVGVRGTTGVALGAALMICALLAAPAFAEANARGGTLQYVDCDQVQSAVRFQYNAGNDDRQVRQVLDFTREQRRVLFGGGEGDGPARPDV